MGLRVHVLIYFELHGGESGIRKQGTTYIQQHAGPAMTNKTIESYGKHTNRAQTERSFNHKRSLPNTSRCPGWVLRHRTKDQLSNFRRKFFLPTCFFTCEIRRQYSREPARCQRTTVSEGLSPVGGKPARQHQKEPKRACKALSSALACLRFRTASC